MVCTCRAMVSRYGHSVPFLTLLFGLDTRSLPLAAGSIRSPDCLCSLFGPSSPSSGLSRFMLRAQRSLERSWLRYVRKLLSKISDASQVSQTITATCAIGCQNSCTVLLWFGESAAKLKGQGVGLALLALPYEHAMQREPCSDSGPWSI